MSTSKIQVQFHIYFSSGVLSNGKVHLSRKIYCIYTCMSQYDIYIMIKKYVIHVWHNAAVLVMPLNTTNFQRERFICVTILRILGIVCLVMTGESAGMGSHLCINIKPVSCLVCLVLHNAKSLAAQCSDVEIGISWLYDYLIRNCIPYVFFLYFIYITRYGVFSVMNNKTMQQHLF